MFLLFTPLTQLNRALREAFKYLPEKKPKPSKRVVEKLENPALRVKAKLPRKLSKSATRFDVPLDPKLLEGSLLYIKCQQNTLLIIN